MARLRVYKKNGGDMLTLVRYQKQELPRTAGMEEVICSAEEVLKSERKNQKVQGALADLPVYTIPYTQIRKIAALKDHIWGLQEEKRSGIVKKVDQSDRIKGLFCLSYSYSKLTLSNFSFSLTYFPQKRIIISEMGNHNQESSCQIVEDFINQEIPCQTVGSFKIKG